VKHAVRAWWERLSQKFAKPANQNKRSLVESLESRQLLSGGLSVQSIVGDNRAQVVITLTTAVKASSVTAGTAQILTAGPDGTLNTPDDAPVTMSLQASGNQIFMTANLPANTLYRVRLLAGKNGVKSSKNKALSGNTGKGGKGGNFDDTTVAPNFIAHFRTVAGDMNVTLASDTPVTNANFLAYANAGAWDNSFIHRKAPFGTDTLRIIQGGGFTVTTDDGVGNVTPNAPIVKENGSTSNVKGTIAMARTDQLDSATSQWFFNTEDNTSLNTTNGGYTAFGQVADAASFNTLAALESNQFPVVNASGGDPNSPFGELPTANYSGTGSIDPKTNLLIVYRVSMLMSIAPSSIAGQVSASVAHSATTASAAAAFIPPTTPGTGGAATTDSLFATDNNILA
jgi:cyclophilin family peptidyl-prolyl cis-trans isomerase